MSRAWRLHGMYGPSPSSRNLNVALILNPYRHEGARWQIAEKKINATTPFTEAECGLEG